MIGSILFVPCGFIRGYLGEGHWRADKVKSGLQKGAGALFSVDPNLISVVTVPR